MKPPNSPEWGPPIVEGELDAETTEGMIDIAERRRIEVETQERRNALLWEKFAGYYGRDGSIVIRPPKHTDS